MRLLVSALLFLTPIAFLAQNGSRLPLSSPASVADSVQKRDHIRRNARRTHPDQRPTVFTENEINAYLASGRAKLPAGVQSLYLTETPGQIAAKAQVDFEAVTAGKRSGSPLMRLFRGAHQVEAEGRAVGRGGQGQLHIEKVSLDGVPVPRAALEFLLDHYVKPKHPGVGLDAAFLLPERIDMVTLGQHMLTLTQK